MNYILKTQLRKFQQGGDILQGGDDSIDFQENLRKIQNRRAISENIFGSMAGVDMSKDASWRQIKNKYGDSALSNAGAIGVGVAANIAQQAVNAVDQATMGDKNFGAGSAMIDTAVHGVSGSLLKSGNPYAMAAGAALEVANFATKAGGQTVEGFDVDINSSGYGNIGHRESKSSRDFGALIGLGGINQSRMRERLARRNAEAQMALKAANVADTTKYEQEARMNSVDDTIRQNQIALAGGIDSSLLGG